MYEALPPPTPGSEKIEAVAKEGAAKGRRLTVSVVAVDDMT